LISIAALGALFLIATALLIVYDKVQSQMHKSDMQSIIVLERIFPQDGKEGRQTLRNRVINKLRSSKLSNVGARRGMASPHFRATLSTLPTEFGVGKDASDPFSNATVMFAGVQTENPKKRTQSLRQCIGHLISSRNVMACFKLKWPEIASLR
jgi:hypothetical protein